MDFSYSEDQESLRALARQILETEVTQDRLKAVAAAAEGIDRRTWNELAKAGLLGISLPEQHGGGGLGFLEASIVLEEIGRTVAPIPYLACVITAALPIAKFGTEAQHAEWLPGVSGGTVILTAALQELANDHPEAPTTSAVREGTGFRVQGEKHFVPAAHLADRMLIPASTPDGVQMILVDPQSPGVALERVVTTAGEPQAHVVLDGANGELLGDGTTNGSAIVEWIVERAVSGICSTQVGVSEKALAITAEYVSTREQFDHPVASFQAVSQRAADAYIDAEAIRLTARQAAWRLAAGRSATDEIAIAKFWAADGGQRVAHAAQHLHGGIGVDVDYPLNRYFTWSKQHELTLGSATRQLLSLGRRLATTP
jgi:alkylation response protein AidB-like acyl-CoA dehydrogenase